MIRQKSQNDKMTILEHLNELRIRLWICLCITIIGAVISFVFYKPIIVFFFTPLQQSETLAGANTLFINTIYEGFLLKIKISLLCGLILSFPVYIFHLLRFLFPGLRKKEKIVITVSIISCTLLFTVGFFYSYYTFIPLSIRFLTGKGFIPEGVGLLLNLEKNVFYIFKFVLAFLIVFQSPVILVILMMLGLLKRKFLLQSTKYMIVGTFVISALLTPPDFISQIGLAVPLIALFFISILIAKIFKFGEEDV